jgi:hypothetical protein
MIGAVMTDLRRDDPQPFPQALASYLAVRYFFIAGDAGRAS